MPEGQAAVGAGRVGPGPRVQLGPVAASAPQDDGEDECREGS
jgi:hypothetical protein